MLGIDEKAGASFEDEKADSRDSNQTGDMNGTASGNDVGSFRVEVVRLLAAESQHMRHNARLQ